eukprot:TRINITY_DN200_c2_g2_i4.p1 TRINITY_DN200_c2_g2~~TRINITY_DN200_c2_g2_i4.p1  ORF type:complete len:161 (+),score=57.44 TRINITY_DN200_c2_g2_i4:228-710(+)
MSLDYIINCYYVVLSQKSNVAEKAQLEVENKTLVQKKSDLEKQLIDEANAFEALKLQLTHKYEVLKQELDVLVKDNRDLKEENHHLKVEMKKLTDENSKLEIEKKQFEGELKRLEDVIAKQDTEKKQLEVENQQLKHATQISPSSQFELKHIESEREKRL